MSNLLQTLLSRFGGANAPVPSGYGVKPAIPLQQGTPLAGAPLAGGMAAGGAMLGSLGNGLPSGNPYGGLAQAGSAMAGNLNGAGMAQKAMPVMGGALGGTAQEGAPLADPTAPTDPYVPAPASAGPASSGLIQQLLQRNQQQRTPFTR
jgi:hypothetical protein